MRISTDMMQRLAVNSMLDRQSIMSKTQQQLATGRRILTPADDPSGSTQVLMLNQTVTITQQYQTNSTMGLNRLQMEESALSSATDSLQRIRELAVQAGDASLATSDRKAIAAEVQQRLGELFDLGNTKSGTGEYLFSGFQSNTQPFVNSAPGVYVYQGDQGQRQVQISTTRQVATSDPGSAIFVNLPYSGGGSQDIFKTVSDFSTALQNNAPIGSVLTDIDTAMSTIANVRAQIGGRMNTINSQQNINDQYNVQLAGTLSQVQDLDYASAVGKLNLQLTGLQAAQLSFQKIQSLSLFNYIH